MTVTRLHRWWPVGVALGLLACLSLPRLPALGPHLRSTVSLPSSPTILPASPAATATSPAAHLTTPSAQELRELQQQVVGLRGLAPTGPVSESILNPEALRRHVLDDFLGDYTPQRADNDGRLLLLLDLLESRTDLRALYRDLYTEQVAGYYDSEANRMFVVAGPAWTGVERLTYVHEFTHVLQDQTFDLEAGLEYSDEACRHDGDRCRALSALLEGDATLVEEQWLRTYAARPDLDDLMEFAATYTSPVFDSAPEAIQRDFLFPYELGLEYVRALYVRDGWAAVDQAYEHPPQTTEEILHPGQSPRPPVAVDMGDVASALGEGWHEIDHGVLGEWMVRLMLERRLEPAEAETAAAGWGGDGYVVLHHEADGEDALVLVNVWDQARDANEFANALRHHAEARFGPAAGAADGTTWTWQDGRIRLVRAYLQTLWIVAPSASEADALLRAVSFPVST